jgi:hypothetical protein
MLTAASPAYSDIKLKSPNACGPPTDFLSIRLDHGQPSPAFTAAPDCTRKPTESALALARIIT